MKFRSIAALALSALMVSPALADDEAKAKKKNKQRNRQSASAQLVKQLKSVGLTDDQVAKIKELGAKATDEMNSIRESAGITAELQKKRIAIQKKLRESDKKGKELIAAINKEAGFTEAHAAAQKKANAVRMKLHHDALALLTDEQKAKLPERLQRVLKAAEKKSKQSDGDKPAKKKKKKSEG